MRVYFFILLFIFVLGGFWLVNLFYLNVFINDQRLYLIKAKKFEKNLDYYKALKYYNRALLVSNIKGEREFIIKKIARLYEENFDYSNAVKYYELYANMKPYNCNVYKKLGYLYKVDLYNYFKSSLYYSLFFDCNKQDYNFNDILNFADSLYNVGSYKKAKDLLEKSSKYFRDIDNNSKQQYFYLLGNVYFMLSKYSFRKYPNVLVNFDKSLLNKSKKFLSKCVNIDINSNIGLMCSIKLSDVLLDVNKYNDALIVLKKIEKLYPSKKIIKNKIQVIKKYYLHI